MMIRTRLFALAAVVALCAQLQPAAQSAVDPSGHWVGTIEVPGASVTIEFDLFTTAGGALAGTIDQPADDVRGLPITIRRQGERAFDFNVREDQGFGGVLAPDGTTIEMIYAIRGFSIPFTARRTGEPRRPEVITSPAVAPALTGAWRATLATRGSTSRLLLTVSNRPDGTSAASVVNLDEGRLRIPATSLRQTGADLTLDFRIVNSSYTGALNRDGTQIVGIFRQGAIETPLTFERERPDAN